MGAGGGPRRFARRWVAACVWARERTGQQSAWYQLSYVRSAVLPVPTPKDDGTRSRYSVKAKQLVHMIDARLKYNSPAACTSHSADGLASRRSRDGTSTKAPITLKSAAQPSATVRKKISRIAKKRFDSSLNRSAEKTITPQPTRERQALPPTMYLPRGAAVLDSAKKQHEAAGAP